MTFWSRLSPIYLGEGCFIIIGLFDKWMSAFFLQFLPWSLCISDRTTSHICLSPSIWFGKGHDGDHFDSIKIAHRISRMNNLLKLQRLILKCLSRTNTKDRLMACCKIKGDMWTHPVDLCWNVSIFGSGAKYCFVILLSTFHAQSVKTKDCVSFHTVFLAKHMWPSDIVYVCAL